MYDEFIRNRITQLRMAKGFSERKMSRALGHSPGYLFDISSRKSLPSMTEFLYICEYFGLTPMEFFDDGTRYPLLMHDIISDLNALDEKQLANIAAVIKGLKK